MNGPGGLLKHLIWIVPVTIFALWYVTQQQRALEDGMDVFFAEHHQDFSAMNAGMSTGEEKKYWEASQKKAHGQLVEAKKRAMGSSKKADDTFAQMEKELNSVDTSNMGESK